MDIDSQDHETGYELLHSITAGLP